jgi:hypothetical protein
MVIDLAPGGRRLSDTEESARATRNFRNFAAGEVRDDNDETLQDAACLYQSMLMDSDRLTGAYTWKGKVSRLGGAELSSARRE